MDWYFILLIIVAATFVAAIIGYVILCLKNPNPSRPKRVTNKTGYVQAVGRNLYDKDGNLLLLKGVNLGNWFDQEFWMAVSSVGNFDTGVYTQKRGIEAMRANPNITDGQIDKLEDIYLDTYVKETDFCEIARLGFNCVRINFTYLNLTEFGTTKLKKDAFKHLDWALEMCEKYNLYAILDLHGAFGSQNQDIHSGDDSQFNLYSSEANMSATCQLWREIALRYKGRGIIAAYDLLNETRRAPNKFTGRKQFDFYNELYRVIREVDENRMLIMECFTFPIHGVKESRYGWTNVCYSYHIYNLTPLSQKASLNFYKALHNLKRYDVPVYIGEWSCWGNEKEWYYSIEFFKKHGWSYSSWTYKTNCNLYKSGSKPWVLQKKMYVWGLFELDIPPVDLSTATFDEIASVWGATGTDKAKATLIHKIYQVENESNG